MTPAPPLTHALRCRCGELRGSVTPAPSSKRVICYCRDCQAFARVLGHAADVLDAAGGTEVLATLPQHVQFTAGLDRLACLSLREGGLLRWYASCCRTPIGNTPRNPRLPYVGLVHSALGSAPARQASFGPLRMAVNRGGASQPVQAPRWANAVGILGLMKTLLLARAGSAWKTNPFFEPGTGLPTRPVQVLDGAALTAAMTAAMPAPLTAPLTAAQDAGVHRPGPR
ncbi:MAG: DUF6151 family protein [Rubrivivax sp.]